MTLPEGIYHRFTCDETDYIHAMRLFIGQPVWTPFNRPQEEHPSRKKFVSNVIEVEDGSTTLVGDETAGTACKKPKIVED